MSVSQNTNSKSKKSRNWGKDVLPFVKEELEKFKHDGIKPTLRSIFYILASRKILDNVQSDYSYLSEFTAKCRKRSVILMRLDIEGARIDGLPEKTQKILQSHQLLIKFVRKRHYSTTKYSDIIRCYDYKNESKKYILKTDEVLPIDSFADETRGVYKDFIDEYKTPEEHIKESLDFIGGLPTEYKELIPKWHNQPYYVEVWTEKNAMVGTLRSILEGLDVRIVYNRGFDSMSNLWQTYQRMKEAWSQGKNARIFYCGDLDPSGDAMDEIINENMKICFDVEKFKEESRYDFKRIGVLYEHIEKFKLPHNPDPKVLEKLKKDRRRKRFIQKYGLKSEDNLFQVEIDALAAFAPLEFKNMILDEIKPYYNNEIYKNLLSDSKHSDDQISLHVMKNVQMFLEEHNAKLMWKWLETST